MNEKNTDIQNWLTISVIGSKIYCECIVKHDLKIITIFPMVHHSHRTKRFSISTAKCQITRRLEWVKESTDTPQNIADEHDD